MSKVIDNPLEKPESVHSAEALIFRSMYPERDPNRLQQAELGNFEVTKYSETADEVEVAFDWIFSYGIWSRAEISMAYVPEQSRYIGYCCDKGSPFQVIIKPSVMEEAIERFDIQSKSYNEFTSEEVGA